ncbi:MAG TPA: amino acid adenylation domain-containing protein [Pyrinomonadaceae bacterium]|nr:amino acid adenylation domain-containing protein [Pyrinomonadaceae bacterium]
MSESLASALRQTAKNFGGRPAVIGPGGPVSYAELDSRSDETAAALQRAGAGPGDRVGIFRKKDVETVACIYGALKAGCAYVPIDTKMGPNRLAAVLNDAGLAALFVEPALAPRLRALVTDGLSPWLADASEYGEMLSFRDATAGGVAASDDGPTAYILYTSGSTGVPKGVQQTHASALAFASWAAKEFDVSSDDRLSCHAPLHFDLTTFDLFVSALTGACVVLIPDDLAIFPAQVASLTESERITVWYSVPFALIQLLQHGRLRDRRLLLREVIFAGERFPPAQLRELASVLPGVGLTNLFGPTETNVCTYHRLTPDDVASDEFCPIGLPCPYDTVVVVDEEGKEVVPGDVGELLVAGASVMTGYLNRPELNERVFVTRQTADGRAERFFRTGDRVTSPGAEPMRFHGRGDRQVKVRGFRIELDEIEAALANCAGVVAAAAWVEQGGNGFAEVRAAVSVDPSSTSPTGNELILQIRRHLNQAGVPARATVLKELPRTVNGKIDYAALAKLVS